MSKKIKISDLKVGMHISLPVAWHLHPFLKSNFTITSAAQIRKLIDYGIKEVILEGLKEEPSVVADVRATKKEGRRATNIAAISDQLKEALSENKSNPEKRAEVIHKYSVSMMQNLWQNPTKERIADFKKSVVSVVDVILSDDATNSQLLRITTYDYNTYIHSVNVGVLAMSLAKAVFRRSDRDNMHELGAGFFLHDIGKIRIDEAIINKTGKLDDEELAVMQTHPDLGFKILSKAKQINEESRLIVLQHHERCNGTGYPKRLSGEDIHVYGRICSVADVFDALVSKRPYKSQLNPFDALKTMKEEMLDHFQKDLFEQFVLLFK